MRRIPSHSDLLLYKAMTEYREVQKLARTPIFELRVFHLKNSIVILYTAILGGDDAVQKLETFFKNVFFEKRRHS